MTIRDDEPPYAPRRAPSERRAGDRQRQLMVRRGVAVGVGLVILILVVLGIRGCLNARKTRSFENFDADLRSLVAQTSQLSKGFFQHLQNPSGNKLTFQTELKTDAGTAATLAERAQTLSTPGELSAAHGDLALSYEFRANALAGIADELASSNTGQATTNHVIAHMKQLLASDVVYGRAQAEIDEELKDQGISETAPPSQFLPNPQQKWLAPSTIDPILSGVGVSNSGGSGSVSGVHGTGIAAATLSGVPLTPNTPLTVTASPPNALAVQIQNQGNSTERDIKVTVKASGGGVNTTKQTAVRSIAAGSVGTATANLGTIPSGTALTIQVNVAPVLGEHVTTNNKATYNVTFQ